MFRKTTGRVVTLATATVGALALAMGPAAAVSAHGISGTVYSPCSSSGWVWYNSQTARTTTGSSVSASFSTLNPGGLNFRLLDQSNGQIGVSQQWSANETGIRRYFTTSTSSGRTFYNSFKELDGKCGYGNYSFSGTEYY